MTRVKYFLFAIIISSATSTSIHCKYDKCSEPWNGGRLVDHTMCLYAEKSFGPECNTVNYSSLTGEEEKRILILQNELITNDTARTVGFIRSLTWNVELATIAQRWANQCEYRLDGCRNIRGVEVGQNIGQVTNVRSFAEFTDLVSTMYSALTHYNSNFTHSVRANTTHMGCGGVKYRKLDQKFVTLLVCNYMWQKDINYQHAQSPSRPKSSVTNNINDRIKPHCEYNECEDLHTRGKKQTHTMCLYPDSTVAAECNDVKQSSLTQAEQEQIIFRHNKARSSTGRDIGEVRWNDTLAVVAQRWANQCSFSNDKCRDMGPMSGVSQNIGMLGKKRSFVYKFSDIVYSWRSKIDFHEFDSGSYNNVDLRDGPYGQLISANTTEVGCGGIKYVDTQGYHNTYLVCNYYPSGRHDVAFVRDFHGSFGAAP